MRNLALHESLESLADQLSTALGRPVFFCSGHTSGGSHFRLPGEDEYQQIHPLKRFLSSYSERYVRRKGNHYYYDLEPASHLVFATPLKKGECDRDIWESTKHLSFPIGRTDGRKQEIKLKTTDQLVVQYNLTDFIHELRSGHHGLRFARSREFQNPLIRQEEWEVCQEVPDYSYKGKLIPETGFRSIRPPGQYSDRKEWLAESHTRYGLCKRTPGPCIVCHGSSGQEEHFGTTSTGPAAITLDGLICLDCFPAFCQKVRGNRNDRK